MRGDAPSTLRPTCNRCGFAAPAGSDEWDRVEDPILGSLTRCPDCGSTDVSSRGTTPG